MIAFLASNRMKITMAKAKTQKQFLLTSAYLRSDQIKALKQLKRNTGHSVQALLREAVDRLIEMPPGKGVRLESGTLKTPVLPGKSPT